MQLQETLKDCGSDSDLAHEVTRGVMTQASMQWLWINTNIRERRVGPKLQSPPATYIITIHDVDTFNLPLGCRTNYTFTFVSTHSAPSNCSHSPN